jgi:hypothetical protein
MAAPLQQMVPFGVSDSSLTGASLASSQGETRSQGGDRPLLYDSALTGSSTHDLPIVTEQRQGAHLASMPPDPANKTAAEKTADALIEEAKAVEAEAKAAWARVEAARVSLEAELSEARLTLDARNGAVRAHHASLKAMEIRVLEKEARNFQLEAQKLRAQAAVARSRAALANETPSASRSNSIGPFIGSD